MTSKVKIAFSLIHDMLPPVALCHRPSCVRELQSKQADSNFHPIVKGNLLEMFRFLYF